MPSRRERSSGQNGEVAIRPALLPSVSVVSWPRRDSRRSTATTSIGRSTRAPRVSGAVSTGEVGWERPGVAWSGRCVGSIGVSRLS
jgi:hypothetical protein